MRYLYKFFFFLILVNLCTLAVAWNYTGHVLIAQIAYDNLTPTAKKQANQLADNVFSHLPLDEQEKLNAHYANASTFAKIATLPDVWRKWRIATIARALDAPLPPNFEPYSQDTIQSWHFLDKAYPDTVQCPADQPENVVWAIRQTEAGFQETKDPNSRALLMVLQEHFVGDVHQPLHVYNRVNLTCQNDRGGNDYCLKYNKRGKCTKNLHALWDSGVGYLKPKTNIQRLAYRLQLIYPNQQFAQQLAEQNVMAWAHASYQYMPFIYSTPKDHKPSPFYYYQGQMIAKQQLVLAGYRLANVLNRELNSK